ncbi:YopJ serine/threonine acetyltransferase [Paraburkholderia sp. BL8N3]|nr:YopJ family acetyltransferase [Paraburkholderia sp. BL8N3]TCK31970.1 YopJ serine/threonine acetyltransferase [Paraburkholderia sp. BL8N3]
MEINPTSRFHVDVDRPEGDRGVESRTSEAAAQFREPARPITGSMLASLGRFAATRHGAGSPEHAEPSMRRLSPPASPGPSLRRQNALNKKAVQSLFGPDHAQASSSSGTAPPSPLRVGTEAKTRERRKSLRSSLESLKRHAISFVRSSKDKHLPPRLRAKIAAVEQALLHASGPLRDYAEEAVARVRRRAPNAPSITTLDIAHLGAMAEVENQRNPGLNLHRFEHQDEFVDVLRADGPASFRAVFPLSMPLTGKPSDHYVMADMRRHPGQPPSIVITESAIIFAEVMPESNQLAKHNRLLDTLENAGMDLSRVAVIETFAQKSIDDCVMFSLHYAIKAHKNAAEFDVLHSRLQQGSTPDASGTSRRSTSLASLEDTFRAKLLTAHAAHGADVLPADFFKHGASLQQAEQLVRRPDRRVAGPVNSATHAKRETLPERNQAFRVLRLKDPTKNDGETTHFSASIDGFRLQEIERALTAAAGQPVAVSKVYA